MSHAPAPQKKKNRVFAFILSNRGNNKGNIISVALCKKRNFKKQNPNEYTTPGGFVDYNEEDFQAMQREFYEETRQGFPWVDNMGKIIINHNANYTKYYYGYTKQVLLNGNIPYDNRLPSTHNEMDENYHMNIKTMFIRDKNNNIVLNNNLVNGNLRRSNGNPIILNRYMILSLIELLKDINFVRFISKYL